MTWGMAGVVVGDGLYATVDRRYDNVYHLHHLLSACSKPPHGIAGIMLDANDPTGTSGQCLAELVGSGSALCGLVVSQSGTSGDCKQTHFSVDEHVGLVRGFAYISLLGRHVTKRKGPKL